MPADLTDTQGYVCTGMLKKTRARFEAIYKLSFLSLFIFILFYFIIKKEDSKILMPSLFLVIMKIYSSLFAAAGLLPPLCQVCPFIPLSTCRGNCGKSGKGGHGFASLSLE